MGVSTNYSSTIGGVSSLPQTLSMTTREPRTAGDRCPLALAYGNGWNTRCRNEVDHPRLHSALGQQTWPYEYVQWFRGDPREFTTALTNLYAWYVDPLA